MWTEQQVVAHNVNKMHVALARALIFIVHFDGARARDPFLLHLNCKNMGCVLRRKVHKRARAQTLLEGCTNMHFSNHTHTHCRAHHKKGAVMIVMVVAINIVTLMSVRAHQF